MEIHFSIGQNHCFELREALLVYRDRQSSFITRHDVQVQKSGPPMLGPAQPLTLAFVESLMRSLGGSVQAEVLPANILAKADRMIVWWTPARSRQMFYENAEGKACDRELLRLHCKGRFKDWIGRSRRIEQLARLPLKQSREYLEEGHYDQPPLPCLLVCFKEQDAIVVPAR